MSTPETNDQDPREPRLAPLDFESATDEQVAVLEPLGGAEALHLFRTLAHNADLTKAWLRFGGHLLMRSSLPERERELVILRVALLCGSDYEWGQHVGIARRAGVSDEEILRIVDGPPADGWNAGERVLLSATDELVLEHDLSDTTWAELSAELDPSQIVELTLLVGHYAMLAGTLRALRVQTESPLPAVGQL